MKRSKLHRGVFAVLNGISFLCVIAIFLLFCSKLYGRMLAQNVESGIPYFRGEHMFYIRLLIISGIAIFCHGLSFFFRPNRSDSSGKDL